jgi:hypothetical protein
LSLESFLPSHLPFEGWPLSLFLPYSDFWEEGKKRARKPDPARPSFTITGFPVEDAGNNPNPLFVTEVEGENLCFHQCSFTPSSSYQLFGRVMMQAKAGRLRGIHGGTLRLLLISG